MEVQADVAEGITTVHSDQGPPERDSQNLIVRAAFAAFEAAGRPPVALSLRCINTIPMGRGLGSSAAAIAAGLRLGAALAGARLGDDELLVLANRLEGHPDNVAPALLGGIRVAVSDGDGVVSTVQVHPPIHLMAVAFIPEVRIPTEDARAALPHEVPFADAAFNIGRAALLVAALAAGDLRLLREATRDRMHQPYRATLFPAGPRLIKAALRAGAAGAFTSGAGPTVLALCGPDTSTIDVTRALLASAEADGLEGSARTLSLSERGAHVVHAA